MNATNPGIDPDAKRLPLPHGAQSTRPGFAELMQARAAWSPAAAPQTAGMSPRALIAPEFDGAYYLQAYEDVRRSGMDPLEHFMLHGAAELRNPNNWFDTGYYVRGNADIADADVNPFWHFLAHGRAEGRRPAPRRRAEHAVVAKAVPASARWFGTVPEDAPRLDREALRAAVVGCAAGRAGLMLSVSHDRYTQSVGGVQILVADEQAAFNERNEAYLHIAPAAARLMLARPDGEPPPVHLTLDGVYGGLTTYADLAELLRELSPGLPATRRFVVHCLLGHQIDPLIALHAALCPAAAVFWVNDYEAVCVGYNLLRNDVGFCGGPPPDSMACRVCAYGEDRADHLAQLSRLFTAIPFHVVAPSEAALRVWNGAARLPHASVRVHEYVHIRPTAVRSGLVGAAPRGAPGNPVRVAFVGYANPNKGWPAFTQLAAAVAGLPEYQLFHLTTLPADPPLPGVETIIAKVSAGARDAMTEALVAASADLVLVLSPWPETFCLVSYEAVAAGADVITVPDSGNVADMVLATGRGVVMPDAASVAEFFTSGAAAAYVRMCGEQGSDMGRLQSRGMTATLLLPDTAPAAPRDFAAKDVAARDHAAGDAAAREAAE